MEVSRQDEIETVTIGAPHLVLLGAGASRTAFPSGEARGRALPLMEDFVNAVPGVRGILGGVVANFEEAYSTLASDPARASDCATLEQLIYNYFDDMQLPPEPTLYDHLVVALRPKDVVATFNWDPFLIQAIRRNRYLKGGYPNLIFLHGNVWMGYCHKDNVLGTRRTRCSTCGEPFEASRLLFPVTDKDYTSDPTISVMWRELERVLRRAVIVTIFGYGAPSSDVEAVALLKKGWGRWEDRQFEQFELIDIADEAVVRGRWKDFIHTHHYEVHDNFYDSWLAQHPRRTGEAYWNQYMEARFVEANPIPKEASFAELEKWAQPLLEAEASVAENPGN